MSAPAMAATGPILSATERRARRGGMARGVGYLVLGLAEVGLGLFRIAPNLVTTYDLVFDDARVQVPGLAVPVGPTVAVMGLLTLVAAGLQLRNVAAPGWRRHLAIVVFAMIVASLTAVLAGKEPSLVGLFAATISFALPIVFAGNAAILCERSGVMNIGIEGTILFGACATTIGGSMLGGPVQGVIVGTVFGLLLGLLLAVLSIRYNVDQVIAGTVLNLGAAGITTFLYTRVLQVHQELNQPGLVGVIQIPVLSDIPMIGPALFSGSFFLYAGYILVVALQFGIYRTRWGLRLRASGENPKAAGTIGIDVLKIRYRSLAAGGAIAGFAGAYLVVVDTGSFVIGMSSGIGFIGIAAMIFGRWNPVGVAGSALVFGFALATGSRLATVGVDIPTVFLNILPYVVTILVVAGLVGRVRGPAAAGQPYEQG
jgi:simple sugar transport system permease protein